MPPREDLKAELERLYRTFDLAYLPTDPLEFVHRYGRDRDREVVGLVASSVAYGRVGGIRATLERIFSVVGSDPYDFAMDFTPEKKALFRGITHRFNTYLDIACLFYFARQMIKESGSIGGFFTAGLSSDHRNVKQALASFSKRALALDHGGIYRGRRIPRDAGVRYFFPSPSAGSACKRLNLYLRWMVRRGDELDFGIWKDVPPAMLIIPLDTHIARISRNIGLTKRKTPGWAMAEEITENLKAFDPEDPVKYDFALSRLGILEKCTKALDVDKCEACSIREFCVL